MSINEAVEVATQRAVRLSVDSGLKWPPAINHPKLGFCLLTQVRYGVATHVQAAKLFARMVEV